MEKRFVILGIICAVFSFAKMNAQDNSDDSENSDKKEMTFLEKVNVGFRFSDADAVALAQRTITEMDTNNPVASATDGYAIRLNRLFGKHAVSEGVNINYKVYLVDEINAFACADGSVRVFAGLMNIMDDNELLAVIGHEIGHVVNHDTKDEIKAAYKKAALMDIASSGVGVNISKTELGKLGTKLMNSKHSRKQESQADLFSYNFMKKYGYDVNAVESAYRILERLREGAKSDIFARMESSHPEPGKRADEAKKRAVKDGLYKAYVQQQIVNSAPVKTVTKAPVKKTTTKKK